MHRRIATLVALLLALTGTSFLSLTALSAPAQAMDANCSDFSSQASAQNYFLNHGGPNSDPDGLDSDGDGIACESNPCPCNTSTGGGGGGGGGTPPKKFHTINLRVAKVGNTSRHLVLGKVPTYRGKFQIQRKLNGGRYKFYKRTLAKNPDGRVKAGLQGPRGTCFQVIVPVTKKYKVTTKKIGCIR